VTRRGLVAVGVIAALVLVIALRYFVWIDPGARCVIGLRPSLVGYDNTTVKRALATLKHGSPQDYRKVCTHVAWINPNPSCGGFGGGCFWHNEGNRSRASVDVSTERGLIWTVAILVHETCHAVQYHEGRPPQFDLEHECYGEDDRILRALVQFE
jgi:hypothetical protein